MTDVKGTQHSAIVFGARNLGRAVIQTLVAEGWAVAGVARSQGTLDGVSEAGGLALQADVTDPASVYAALEEVAAAHGGIDLALNAVAAYGGDCSAPDPPFHPRLEWPLQRSEPTTRGAICAAAPPCR